MMQLATFWGPTPAEPSATAQTAQTAQVSGFCGNSHSGFPLRNIYATLKTQTCLDATVGQNWAKEPSQGPQMQSGKGPKTVQ